MNNMHSANEAERNDEERTEKVQTYEEKINEGTEGNDFR